MFGGKKHIIKALWQALHDKDIDNRMDAAAALVLQLSDVKVVRSFWEVIHGEDIPLRHAITQVFGQTEGTHIFKEIWQKLENERISVSWKSAQALLNQVRDDRTVVVWLALYDEDNFLSSALPVASLMTDALLEIEMGMPGLVHAAARELARINWKEREAGIRVLDDVHLNVYSIVYPNSVDATATLGPGQITNVQGFNALQQALGNEDAKVRSAMAWALGHIGGEISTRLIRRWLQVEIDESVRQVMQKALETAEG